MKTHDFKDGNGAVPAHQHINGGGWVANTATKATTMRKRHNGFVKLMRKRDGKPFLDPSRPLEVGDKVLVKSTDVSTRHLGGPRDFVGEVRQVYATRTFFQEGEDGLMYSLCPENFGAWYLAEDLERLP